MIDFKKYSTKQKVNLLNIWNDVVSPNPKSDDVQQIELKFYNDIMLELLVGKDIRCKLLNGIRIKYGNVKMLDFQIIGAHIAFMINFDDKYNFKKMQSLDITTPITIYGFSADIDETIEKIKHNILVKKKANCFDM